MLADEDYRGNVGVILFNHSDAAFPGEFLDSPQNNWHRCG